jgi:N-acetylglucosaminyldiphosphoundecaprenol N-acetyl-beta-D-mannosaminyltransferase
MSISIASTALGTRPEPGQPTRFPVRNLFGLSIAAVTMPEVLDWIDETIARRGRLRLGVVNAAKIVNMRRDAALRLDVVSSDAVLADGMSVVWASRLLRRPLPERVTGIDLMLGMLERGDQRGYRVYCLGATPDVLARTTAHIAAHYPNVRLVGQHHGYFGAGEEAAIAAEIAAGRPDILFVAMTSPKKEQFLARWSERLGVPVCHGVGGSFDVLAQAVRRAPEAWQRLGLEWLYRVVQEPRRLWKRYLVTNTVFCAMVLSALLRRRSGWLRMTGDPQPE